MARKILFEVYGKQAPCGSKRVITLKDGRSFLIDANKNAAKWKDVVAKTAKAHYQGPLLDGALSLVVVFTIERPKNHTTSKGLPSSTWREYPSVMPDATKLLRGTEDALTGIVWHDDGQIVRQHVYKQYGDAFKTTISIEEIEPSAATTPAPSGKPDAEKAAPTHTAPAAIGSTDTSTSGKSLKRKRSKSLKHLAQKIGSC